MKFVWHKDNGEKVNVNVVTFQGNKILISLDDPSKNCNKTIADLSNCEVIFCNSDGIMVSGFEQFNSGENYYGYQRFDLKHRE